MNKKIASDLIAFKKAFAEADIPWVIIDGLVLGCARHGGIIPWDTDIDLAVCIELTPQQREKLLYETLLRWGFRMPPQDGDFIWGMRAVTFNLWFYHKDGVYYTAYPTTTPKVKFIEKAIHYNKITMVDFMGDTYPFPNWEHHIEYLADRYGKDWETERYGHDEWFKEKRGTFNNTAGGQDDWVKSRCGKDGDLWPKILYREDEL